MQTNEQSLNLEVNGSFQGSAHSSARKRRSPKKSPLKDMMSSPGKPSKIPPNERHKLYALKHAQSFEVRSQLLRQNSKVTDEDLEEYKKTEIIRKSVADVKKRAKEAEFIRKSPEKVYAKVKSRIACNMKSQKKAKKTAKKIAQNIEA